MCTRMQSIDVYIIADMINTVRIDNHRCVWIHKYITVHEMLLQTTTFPDYTSPLLLNSIPMKYQSGFIFN